MHTFHSRCTRNALFFANYQHICTTYEWKFKVRSRLSFVAAQCNFMSFFCYYSIMYIDILDCPAYCGVLCVKLLLNCIQNRCILYVCILQLNVTSYFTFPYKLQVRRLFRWLFFILVTSLVKDLVNWTGEFFISYKTTGNFLSTRKLDEPFRN